MECLGRVLIFFAGQGGRQEGIGKFFSRRQHSFVVRGIGENVIDQIHTIHRKGRMRASPASVKPGKKLIRVNKYQFIAWKNLT